MGYKYRRRFKPVRPTEELCQQASEMLKAAGFELHCASMKTEACYYRWPGKRSLLRVAAHSKHESPPGLGHVAAKITFNGTHLTSPEFMRIADEKVETMVAIGIGQYFLRARSAHPQEPVA